MIYPCKGCTERHIGCHSKCERYNECLKKHREIKQKELGEMSTANAIHEIRDHKFRSLGYR